MGFRIQPAVLIPLPMVWWSDSHAHLYDCVPSSLAGMIIRARENGVHRIVNVATSLASSRTVISQSDEFPGLMCAVGVSPFDVCSAPRTWEEELAALVGNSHVVAVGETGIDATNPSYPSMELQLAFFKTHLALAMRFDKPVVVHSRGCEKQAVDICISSGVKRAVFHCYTGDEATLNALVEAGYFVSFSGIVTFAKSPLAKIIAAVPLRAMLIETDTPYLTPVPHRGKPNEPSWVSLVGKKVSEIKSLGEAEFAAALEENFDRAFGTR